MKAYELNEMHRNINAKYQTNIDDYDTCVVAVFNAKIKAQGPEGLKELEEDLRSMDSKTLKKYLKEWGYEKTESFLEMLTKAAESAEDLAWNLYDQKNFRGYTDQLIENRRYYKRILKGLTSGDVEVIADEKKLFWFKDSSVEEMIAHAKKMIAESEIKIYSAEFSYRMLEEAFLEIQNTGILTRYEWAKKKGE